MGVRTPPPAKTHKKRKRGEKKRKRERDFCVCVRNPKPYMLTHAFFFCVLCDGGDHNKETTYCNEKL